MKIRRMTSQDIENVMKYEVLYFGQTLGENHFNIESNSEDAYFLVLEDESNNLCGYISSTVDEYAEILNFFIVESYRGKGLGYELLKAVIDEANKRHCKSIYLEVSVLNESAIALYKKCGFKIDRIRKSYYKDIDAYAMIKEL